MDYRKVNTKILYIMESRSLIKIGISSDPYQRVEKLNENVLDTDYFKVIYTVNFSTKQEAYRMEQQIHREFKTFNIRTDILGAKTECFSKDCLPAVYEYLKNTETELHYYDPFIYVDNADVSRVLGVSMSELVINYRVSKTFITRFKQVIRNLAANILVANGRKIFYTKNQMRSFSIATNYTYKIFDLIYPAFSAKIPIESDIEVKLIKLNHWRKWFHKYDVATKTHISNLYSLKNYMFGCGERSDNYLRKLIEYVNDNCIVEVK